ncbi:MAG TPA: hypothetical protein VFW00_06545 [Rhodocyclaceae bacterium]|nr:hypothetical protein [Rhodocyclaceae bacterium]
MKSLLAWLIGSVMTFGTMTASPLGEMFAGIFGLVLLWLWHKVDAYELAAARWAEHGSGE